MRPTGRHKGEDGTGSGVQPSFGGSYEELMDSYRRRFKEGFPTYLAPSDVYQQMLLMREALASGKAYDPYRDPSFDLDADY